MESSPAKLNVLGVYDSDQHAFLGEVDSIPCEEMIDRSVLGGGKNGAGTSHGEKEQKAT